MAVLISNYLVVALAIFVIPYYSVFGQNDTECHHDMTAHMKCMQTKHEENILQDQETIRDAENRIILCFTDNNCSPPNLSRQPQSFPRRPQKLRHHDTPLNKNDTKFKNSLFDAVEQCIKRNTEKTAVDKLNQCLQSHGVEKLNDIPPHPHMHGLRRSNETDDGFRTFFSLHHVISQSIMKCKRQTDESIAYQVATCAHSVKTEVKLGQLCPRLLACEDEQVSSACRRRSSDIRGALCKCRQERLQEAIENLEMLKLRDGDIDRSELINAVSHVDEDCRRENIRKCYKEYGFIDNREDKGSIASPLNLDDVNHSNSSLVTQDQLDDIKFLLLIKLKEEDCNECRH